MTSNMDSQATQIAQLGYKYGHTALAGQAIAEGVSLDEFTMKLMDALVDSSGYDSGNVIMPMTGFHFGRWLQYVLHLDDNDYAHAAAGEISALNSAGYDIESLELPQEFMGYELHVPHRWRRQNADDGLVQCMYRRSQIINNCSVVEGLDTPVDVVSDVAGDDETDLANMHVVPVTATLRISGEFSNTHPGWLASEVLPEIGRQMRENIEIAIIRFARESAHSEIYQPGAQQPSHEKWTSSEMWLNKSYASDDGRIYVVSPDVYERAQLLRQNGGGDPILCAGYVNTMYPCVPNRSLAATTMMMGAFSDVKLGFWKAVQFSFKHYKSSGDYTIDSAMNVGIQIRSGNSFVVKTAGR